ncbi:LIM domain-binding protein 1 [Galemys pyrenaicus]|uniref:LIM domain-binding protein 1 n=1 Tax=Galemys pyrenaicus TaxID=202257 RepID=A0A8J6AMF3_GALPY|nr:LIM domain-binding protein 1 [Galemys pyrenaicus]
MHRNTPSTYLAQPLDQNLKTVHSSKNHSSPPPSGSKRLRSTGPNPSPAATRHRFPSASSLCCGVHVSPPGTRRFAASCGPPASLSPAPHRSQHQQSHAALGSDSPNRYRGFHRQGLGRDPHSEAAGHRLSVPGAPPSWPLNTQRSSDRRRRLAQPIVGRRAPERASRNPFFLSFLGCSSKSFKLYSPKEPPNGNAFPPFHPGTMLDRDVGPTPMYPPTYLEPGIGRHTPYGNQTDYRIFELNKRLQNWTEECDNLWWDAFTTEFFEDDAMLTITFCLEDGPKRYTIGRTLIPRYFRSIFEGGATELYYVLKHPKEAFHSNFVSLDCDQGSMVTQHGKPMFTQVCVEGRLYLEFMFDDMMRIKTWHFSIRQHRELIPRSILAMHAQDPQMLDQLSKNITRCGLSNSTLNYLRLCVILEPMQELMSRHKTYSLSPRDCLKTCLFQKWQRMVAPPAEPARQQPSKRRKRKMSGGSTMSSGGGNTNNSNSKKKSPASTFALSSQDVMVVGEPTLMGGEFGDEDERLITRLENTQFDAANGIDDEDSFNNSPALGANSPWNSKPPSSQESKSENPTSQASQ